MHCIPSVAITSSCAGMFCVRLCHIHWFNDRFPWDFRPLYEIDEVCSIFDSYDFCVNLGYWLGLIICKVSEEQVGWGRLEMLDMESGGVMKKKKWLVLQEPGLKKN